MRQKSRGADNQQETTTEEEKAWLAGIIDGEGCFQVRFNRQDQRRCGVGLDIKNQNYKIIQRTADIIRKLGVGPRIYGGGDPNAACRKCYGMGQKTCVHPIRVGYCVQVIGFKRLKAFIPTVLPYLIGKHDEALATYRLCESRVASWDSGLKWNGWSDYEVSLVQDIMRFKDENKGRVLDPQRLHAGVRILVPAPDKQEREYHVQPKSCTVCGKDFRPSRRGRKTCSPKCGYTWRSRNKRTHKI